MCRFELLELKNVFPQIVHLKGRFFVCVLISNALKSNLFRKVIYHTMHKYWAVPKCTCLDVLSKHQHVKMIYHQLNNYKVVLHEHLQVFSNWQLVKMIYPKLHKNKVFLQSEFSYALSNFRILKIFYHKCNIVFSMAISCSS